MIAIPRLSAPQVNLGKLRGLLARPAVGVGAAGVLFVGALAAVVAMARPGEAEHGVEASLADAFAHAPPGWREALKPGHDGAPGDAVLQLSERPFSGKPAPALAAPVIAGPTSLYIDGPLPHAPIAGLFQPGPAGALPIIAADGRTPFQAYARPFNANGKPKVALVVGGLGMNARTTQQAIETLPGPVTLSFVPYAENLQNWIDLARAHGHEVMLETPMEPMDYPDNDPGPYTLMADAEPREMAPKLEWVMSRATGYFGLMNYAGSRFLTNGPAYAAFAKAAGARGLGFVDDGVAREQSGGGLPRLSADRVVDTQLDQKAIDHELLLLEASALQHGQAMGLGYAYPVTLAKAVSWAASVEQRGYQLAPASALAAKR